MQDFSIEYQNTTAFVKDLGSGMSSALSLCWKLMGLVLFCFCSLISYSHNYQADGTLKYSIYAPNEDKPVSVTSRKYFAAVMEDQWLIRVEGSGKVLYHEIGCDGKYIYNYSAFQVLNDDVKIENSGGYGSVENGIVPTKADQMSLYVWLALASSAYFAEHNSGDHLIPPWKKQAHEQDLVETDFKLSSEAPFLPLEIKFWRTSLDQEWVRGIFTRLESTVYNSQFIPTEWKYVDYGRPSQGVDSSLKGDIRVVFEGIVEKIEDAFGFDPKPKIQENILVTDYRFSVFDPPIEHVQYVLKDGIWSDLKSGPAYTEYLNSVGVSNISLKEDRFQSWRVMLFLLLGLGFIVFASLIMRKKLRINRC